MKFCEEHQKHFIDDRGCITCIASIREDEEDDHLFHAQQLKVTTHFIVDLAFEHHSSATETLRGIGTLRGLRELIGEVLRLIEPDTIHVTLTTGDKPLDLSQQVTAVAIETSSKTGNVFPINSSNAGNLQFSSADSTIATVSSNGDGTATVTPVAVGTTTISCTDTFFGITGSVSVSVTAVVADAPDTLTLTLGTPFPAGTSGNQAKASTAGAIKVN